MLGAGHPTLSMVRFTQGVVGFSLGSHQLASVFSVSDHAKFKSEITESDSLIILVIRSVSDVLRAQSRFVKFVGGEAAGQTPYTFYKLTLGPKYVRNRPYNEFITPTTFI